MSISYVSDLNISSLTPLQAVVTDAGRNLVSTPYTSASTPSTLVARDAAGNFSANTITASLNGTASTVITNANLTGPITSVGNATTVASQTGTGSTFVMNVSPTIITPSITSIVNGGGTVSVPVGVTDTLVARSTTDTLTNKIIVSPTNTVRATQLATTGSDVVIAASTPPTVGQTLVATSATAAQWQSPALPGVESLSPYILYSTGTVSQTGTTVTGTGTTFTTAMVNGIITIGQVSTLIVSFTSATVIVVANSATVAAGSAYRISFIAPITTTSTSFTLVASSGLSIAPTPGKFTVLFSGTVSTSNASRRCGVGIFYNGILVPSSRRDFQIATANNITPISTSAIVSATYSAGTVSQSGLTVTGTGTTFTSAMIGGRIIINSVSATITAVSSATLLTVNVSQTVGSTSYIIYLPITITVQFTVYNSATTLTIYDRVINATQVV